VTYACIAAACAAVLAVATACVQAHAMSSGTKGPGITFVAAPPNVVADCRVTARLVGYPVPCPMRVPQGTLEPTVVGHDCTRIYVVGTACSGSWHGWVFGSTYVGRDHLVITASPRPLSSDAKLVNGPSWYPQAKVTQLGPVTINGRRMHAVFVPPATNESAFMDHVVLIWTTGGHTYGVGFHDVSSIRQTLLKDVELAKSIKLIGP
jgi:hypothetical protein